MLLLNLAFKNYILVYGIPNHMHVVSVYELKKMDFIISS